MTGNNPSIHWLSKGHLEHLVAVEFMPLAADEKRHRLSSFKRYAEDLFGVREPDFEPAATPLKFEAERAPACRKLGIERYALVAHRQPCETEDGRQPNPAQGRYVQAAVDRHMAVREIDRRGFPKVSQRLIGVA